MAFWWLRWWLCCMCWDDQLAKVSKQHSIGEGGFQLGPHQTNLPLQELRAVQVLDWLHIYWFRKIHVCVGGGIYEVRKTFEMRDWIFAHQLRLLWESGWAPVFILSSPTGAASLLAFKIEGAGGKLCKQDEKKWQVNKVKKWQDGKVKRLRMQIHYLQRDHRGGCGGQGSVRVPSAFRHSWGLNGLLSLSPLVWEDNSLLRVDQTYIFYVIDVTYVWLFSMHVFS